MPVYIWSPEEDGRWPPGAASRWWLHHSLIALDMDLRKVGLRLIIRRSATAAEALSELIRETGADAVFWNRRYEPHTIARDAAIKSTLTAAGIHVESFNSALLFEPWEISTKEQRPFQVYTAFWRACGGLAAPAEPLPGIGRTPKLTVTPASAPVSQLALLPDIEWTAGISAAWTPGARGAMDVLDRFLDVALDDYADQRDRPDLPRVSRLSPHLHFGDISPRFVWHAVQARVSRSGKPSAGAEKFLNELGWREFSHHLLYHFPYTADQPLRPEFASFAFAKDDAALHAWQRGRTGYPIVDAGMRELWHTGWMHNRVRMIAASFLVKDLLISWQSGAAWFWDTLVDADLAQNTLGWQWTAGCGADAAPYFRVFNPVIQGEKFDPEGTYVRKWVKELSEMPNDWIHEPWNAPPLVLQAANVELGRTYPKPMVDHAAARDRALRAFEQIKRRESR